MSNFLRSLESIKMKKRGQKYKNLPVENNVQAGPGEKQKTTYYHESNSYKRSF